MNSDWSWIARIETLCREAGAFQMRHFREHPPGWGDEKAAKNYVSHIDIESERMLKDGLYAICPEAGFYGEESERIPNEALEWVVDPLDGTTNYLSGYDVFTISVGLVRHGEPTLGVVYRPATGDCFAAARGQGARKNGAPLPKHAAMPLANALIGTGSPFRSPDLADAFFASVKAVMAACRDIRRPGSAALDLSYVAAGYFQGFWEQDLQPYDVAAALCILAETGCRVSGLRQKPYDMFADRVLIAGLPGAQEELCEIVSRYYSGA